MLIRVVDLEATGFPTAEHRPAICEVGWSDVILGPNGEPLPVDYDRDGFTSYLCDPGRPMPPEARAVHHLSDMELAGQKSPDHVLRIMNDDCPDAYCAHNAAYEREFFTGGGKPWICTLKVARRVWPDAPDHKNQTLRYWLGIDLDDALAMPPHRAGPDAYVTAHILRRAFDHATFEQMVEWTNQPSLLPGKMSFGKHKGSPWSEAPTDYLRWIVDKSDMDDDTKFTARHHLKERGR